MPRVVLGDERTNFAYHSNYHCAYPHTGESFRHRQLRRFSVSFDGTIVRRPLSEKPHGDSGSSSFLRTTKKILQTETTSPRRKKPIHSFLSQCQEPLAAMKWSSCFLHGIARSLFALYSYVSPAIAY